MRSSFSMLLLYHAYVYLEFLILACTIYILAQKLYSHSKYSSPTIFPYFFFLFKGYGGDVINNCTYLLNLIFLLILHTFLYNIFHNQFHIINCPLLFLSSFLLCKYLRNIPMPIHHPVNLYILISNLIQHYIIPANHILIIRPEADSLGKIRSHIRKLLYILKSGIYLLNGFYCHFLSSSTLIQALSSLTASSASCSFMNNFFSAFSRS